MEGKGASKTVRLAVAMAFALVAAVVTALIYFERDLIFQWDWAKPHGRFQAEPDETLERLARDYAETQRPGAACVGKWLGKDEKFLYLALGCARFDEKMGKLEVEGDTTYIPSRFRYSGQEIRSFEQPNKNRNAYENGIRRIFPLPVYEKFRSIGVSDFQRNGLKRMAERGISP